MKETEMKKNKRDRIRKGTIYDLNRDIEIHEKELKELKDRLYEIESEEDSPSYNVTVDGFFQEIIETVKGSRKGSRKDSTEALIRLSNIRVRAKDVFWSGDITYKAYYDICRIACLFDDCIVDIALLKEKDSPSDEDFRSEADRDLAEEDFVLEPDGLFD